MTSLLERRRSALRKTKPNNALPATPNLPSPALMVEDEIAIPERLIKIMLDLGYAADAISVAGNALSGGQFDPIAPRRLASVEGGVGLPKRIFKAMRALKWR